MAYDGTSGRTRLRKRPRVTVWIVKGLTWINLKTGIGGKQRETEELKEVQYKGS